MTWNLGEEVCQRLNIPFWGSFDRGVSVDFGAVRCQEASRAVMKTSRQEPEFGDHKAEGSCLVPGFVLGSTQLVSESKYEHGIDQPRDWSLAGNHLDIWLDYVHLSSQKTLEEVGIIVASDHPWNIHIQYQTLNRNNQKSEKTRLRGRKTEQLHSMKHVHGEPDNGYVGHIINSWPKN